MRTLVAAVALAALIGGALPASAEDGNSSLTAFRAETAKARAQGGYGNPLVAVPQAIMQALFGSRHTETASAAPAGGQSSGAPAATAAGTTQ